MDKTYTSSVTMRPASARSRYRSRSVSASNAADGAAGADGRDGVGISSVSAKESTSSGGVNVVTVRLTDGTESKFNVRNGVAGADGKSAYDLAVEAGFDGDETAWLGSLKGERGARGAAGVPGQSAYEIAVAGGFEGDENEWLGSLKGTKGDTGAAAGFGTPKAKALILPAAADPTLTVTASGPDEAKVFSFELGIPSTAKDVLAQLKVRPVLTMMIGTTKDEIGVAEIGVLHPLLQRGSNQYEAVLMAYRGRNGRVTGSSQYIEKLRMYKKGWAVALGDYKLTGHKALTASAGAKFGAAFGLTDLRDFIVQRFMTDSGHTQSELMTRTYQQWKSESNKDRGFGSQRRSRHRFGIAVRCENPAFLAAVDTSKTLASTTQTIWDDNGNRYDRYLYSDVAPLDVMLSTPANGRLRSEMWFGLVER